MTTWTESHTYWKCDNCQNVTESILTPMDWWVVKAGNWEGHLCPDCSPAIRAYLADWNRKMGDD